MRSFIATFALLALAACGQGGSTTAPAAQDAPTTWQTTMAASAETVQTYPLSDVKALGGGAVRAGADTTQITTDPTLGSLSGILDLGSAAAANRPMAVRVSLNVNRGGVQFFIAPKGWGADFTPANLVVVRPGGPDPVYLPITQHDANQVLMIANGGANGASVGDIASITLVAASADGPP